MSFRSDRFNRSMRSLEKFAENYKDASKIATLSDRGASVARMIEQIEPTPDEQSNHEQMLRKAIRRLYRLKQSSLIPILKLIIKYGSNTQESIGELQKAMGSSWSTAAHHYFVKRHKLILIFVKPKRTNRCDAESRARLA